MKKKIEKLNKIAHRRQLSLHGMHGIFLLFSILLSLSLSQNQVKAEMHEIDV
jgi:hypothetical protein